MNSTVTAPTIPPRVRLDDAGMPAHDVLTVLARREQTRNPIPSRIAVVYSSRRRMHG